MKHFNITRHRKVLKNRNVRRQLRRLAHEWPKLSELVRGRRVQKLLDAGLTFRGLASPKKFGGLGLPSSEGTLRRYVEVAYLPTPLLEQVESGKMSADRALVQSRNERRQLHHRNQMANELARRQEIDRFKTFLTEMLDEVGLEHARHREQVFDAVEHQIHERECLHRQDPKRFPLPSFASASAPLRETWRASRPVMSPSEEASALWPEILVPQMVEFTLRAVPSEEIRYEVLRQLRVEEVHLQHVDNPHPCKRRATAA